MPTVEEIWAAGFGSGATRRTAGQLLAEARNAAVANTIEVTALRVVVERLAAVIEAGGGTVDTAAILEGVRVEVRDAVADLGEGGAAQVRGPQG